MDVNTQKNIVMTMKEWQKYFDDPVRDKLLNVLSLEFSHTKLDNYVQSPMIVSCLHSQFSYEAYNLKKKKPISFNDTF